VSVFEPFDDRVPSRGVVRPSVKQKHGLAVLRSGFQESDLEVFRLEVWHE
jgi:hypothetical protein